MKAIDSGKLSTTSLFWRCTTSVPVSTTVLPSSLPCLPARHHSRNYSAYGTYLYLLAGILGVTQFGPTDHGLGWSGSCVRYRSYTIYQILGKQLPLGRVTSRMYCDRKVPWAEYVLPISIYRATRHAGLSNLYPIMVSQDTALTTRSMWNSHMS